MLDEKLLKVLIDAIVPLLALYIGTQLKALYARLKTKNFLLSEHELFTEIKKSISEIRRWSIKENRKVFIDALIIKLEFWLNEGIKLANDLDKNYYNKRQLRKIFFDWVTNTINLYNSEWKKVGIPGKIVDMINKNHEPNVIKFSSEIDNIIFNDDIYFSYKIKVINIFNILRLLLEVTKTDFQDLIYRDKLNGNLHGLTYNNKPISDDEFDKFVSK